MFIIFYIEDNWDRSCVIVCTWDLVFKRTLGNVPNPKQNPRAGAAAPGAPASPAPPADRRQGGARRSRIPEQ